MKRTGTPTEMFHIMEEQTNTQPSVTFDRRTQLSGSKPKPFIDYLQHLCITPPSLDDDVSVRAHSRSSTVQQFNTRVHTCDT